MSVTSPITACASSHFSQIASTCSRRSATQTATIRSWLSETMISQASISSSRSGTRSRSTSTPAPSRAISAREDASPAAPQSWSDSTSPRSTSSRLDSISFLPVNGSPICTVGRLSASSSASSALARTLAPPIPSRPVVAPYRTSSPPVSVARARVSRSTGSSPTHMAFTRQFPAYASSKTASPPTVGTPTQFP